MKNNVAIFQKTESLMEDIEIFSSEETNRMIYSVMSSMLCVCFVLHDMILHVNTNLRRDKKMLCG